MRAKQSESIESMKGGRKREREREREENNGH